MTRFVLGTLAYLAVAFAVWYLAAPVLMWPALLAVRAIAAVGFGDLVRGVEQSGTIATFVTTLHSGSALTSVVSVDVNVLLYSFGLPLFAALTLAAREKRWRRDLALGYGVVTAVVAFGALADFLKNVAITAGPALALQTGFVAWQREAIAFAFQFGALILPAVAPAVLWVALHGRFVAGPRTTRTAAAVGR